METESVGVRIARGVAALDAAEPNWRGKIVRPIRLSQFRDCVVGQVSGNTVCSPDIRNDPNTVYGNFLRKLGWNPSAERWDQFELRHGFYVEDDNETWEHLRSWREIIGS